MVHDDAPVGLGRLPSPPDERDRNFMMEAAPDPDALPAFRYWPYMKPVLNQGNEPKCVAFGANHYLMAHPVINKPLDPHRLYDECQAIDGWPLPHDGTSVRALCKVLQRRGLIGTYTWAWDLERMQTHLLTKGPVMLGINWYRGMNRPDAKGFIKPAGPLDGGHFIVALGRNRLLKKTQLLNTWGRDWGGNGRAWIHDEDLARLISEQGEVAAAQEVRSAASPAGSTSAEAGS